MSLQMDTEFGRHALIFRLKGELDHHTAEQVRKQMEEAIAKSRVPHVIFNLKDLQFMDSSGLGVFLGRYKLVNSLGGKMVLCDVNPSVYRLFEMSGMFKIVAVEPDEASAISSLEVVS